MCTLYLIILQQQVSDVAAVVCGDLHKYCTNSRVPICIIRGLVDAVGFGESCLITLYLIPVMVTVPSTKPALGLPRHARLFLQVFKRGWLRLTMMDC